MSQNVNLNSEFCNFLTELANYERNVNRNVHKYNAYRKAAGVLAAHSKRIESGDEARKLKGVGDKISKKIDEYLQTGTLKKIQNIQRDDTSVAISLLTRVSGIGPAKAKELVDQGYKTISDLRLKGPKLNHHQSIGLNYFEDFEKPIPRSEIEAIETKLKEKIYNLDDRYSLTICGSYRRGKITSGDIDVLITHPKYTNTDIIKTDKKINLKNIVEILKQANIVIDTLSIGDTKFMGVCRLSEDTIARRLDIRLIPCDQYYCAILYFTGSDVFNKTMRGHALERGFTLNEYTLRPLGSTGVPGEPVPILSEEDIFNFIEFPFKIPEHRNM